MGRGHRHTKFKWTWILWLCVDICVSAEAQSRPWRRTEVTSPLHKGRKPHGNVSLQALLHNPCFLRSKRFQVPDFPLQWKTWVADRRSHQKTGFDSTPFGYRLLVSVHGIFLSESKVFHYW